MSNWWKQIIAIVFLLTGTDAAHAICGGPLGQNSWMRPLDYRDPKDDPHLKSIEGAHFDQETENLVRGMNEPLPGDIHYVLMRFVNHYRALNSMATWQLKNGFTQGRIEYLPVDCYFERAVAFTPDDPVIYIIWGNYLTRKKQYDRALTTYKEAERLDPENSEVHYDLGLLYLRLDDLDKAQTHARLAYAQDYPLPGLRNLLRKRGVNIDE